MARIRNSRSVEIVHSSFIDLLFGAFGAFVFIMITYVILTMNLTPDEVKGVIDKYANANKTLTEKVENLGGKVAQLTAQVKDKQKVEDENRKLKEDLTQARQTAAKAKGEAEQARQEAANAEKMAGKYKEEKEKAEQRIAALEGKIKEMQPPPSADDASERIAQLEGQLADVKGQVDKLGRDNKALNQKNKALNQKNEALKNKLAAYERQKKKSPTPAENLEGKQGTVHAWLKYLFLLFLYILGSELSAAISRGQSSSLQNLFKRHNIQELVDHSTGERKFVGLNEAVVNQVTGMIRKFKISRTLLWLAIIVGAGVYLVKVMQMSLANIWIPATIAIVLYAYLRKRFDLL